MFKLVAAVVMWAMMSIPQQYTMTAAEACTKDNHPVTARITFNASGVEAHKEAIEHVTGAFVKTASEFTAEALVTQAGFEAFISNLPDTADYDALASIAEPEVGEGKCEASGK